MNENEIILEKYKDFNLKNPLTLEELYQVYLDSAKKNNFTFEYYTIDLMADGELIFWNNLFYFRHF